MTTYKSITQISPTEGELLQHVDGSIWEYNGLQDTFAVLQCIEASQHSIKKVGDTRKLNGYNQEFLFDWVLLKKEFSEEQDEEDYEEAIIDFDPFGEDEDDQEPMSGPQEPEPNFEEITPKEFGMQERKKPRRVKQQREDVLAAPKIFWHYGRMKKCLQIAGFDNKALALFDDNIISDFNLIDTEIYDCQDEFIICGNLMTDGTQVIVTTGQWRISHGIREFEAIFLGGAKKWIEFDVSLWKSREL